MRKHKKTNDGLSLMGYYRPIGCSDSLDYCLQMLRHINKVANVFHVIYQLITEVLKSKTKYFCSDIVHL